MKHDVALLVSYGECNDSLVSSDCLGIVSSTVGDAILPYLGHFMLSFELHGDYQLLCYCLHGIQ